MDTEGHKDTAPDPLYTLWAKIRQLGRSIPSIPTQDLGLDSKCPGQAPWTPVLPNKLSRLREVGNHHT